MASKPIAPMRNAVLTAPWTSSRSKVSISRKTWTYSRRPALSSRASINRRRVWNSSGSSQFTKGAACSKALIFFSVVLLAMRRFAVPGYQIDNWVVVAVVGKDLWIVAGFLVLYLVTDRFRSHATLFGKAATVGLCVLIPAVLLGPELDALLDGLGTWLLLVLEALVTGLCVLAAVTYTRVGLRFAHEQGKPLDNAPSEPGTDHGPDS